MPTDFNSAVLSAIIIGTLIIVLHFLCCLINGGITRILAYLNIALHLALFVLLFLSGADFEFVVCCFMASTLIYSLLSYVSHKHEKATEEVSERDV